MNVPSISASASARVRRHEERLRVLGLVDARRLESTCSKPAAASFAAYSLSSSAPATQPIHSSMFLRTAAGTSCPARRRRRRRSGRRASGRGTPRAARASLSAERLITQLEMITSTESSGSGMCSISPLAGTRRSARRLRLVLSREREHLVGHVEAVGLARRPDAARREQHVDAAAGAEVEHRLPGLQLRQRRRVAAAERRDHRLHRQLRQSARIVEVRRDGVAAPPSPPPQPQHVFPAGARRRLPVFLLHDGLDGDRPWALQSPLPLGTTAWHIRQGDYLPATVAPRDIFVKANMKTPCCTPPRPLRGGSATRPRWPRSTAPWPTRRGSHPRPARGRGRRGLRVPPAREPHVPQPTASRTSPICGSAGLVEARREGVWMHYRRRLAARWSRRARGGAARPVGHADASARDAKRLQQVVA